MWASPRLRDLLGAAFAPLIAIALRAWMRAAIRAAFLI